MDIAWLLRGVTILAQYMSIIPVGVGLYCWPYLRRSLRLFWVNVFTTFLISMVNEYLIGQRVDNMPMVYISSATDALLLTAFFTAYIPRLIVRRVFVGLCATFLLFMAWAIWTWGHSLTTALTLSSVESCLVVAMAVVVLREQLLQMNNGSLRRQPVVYLTVGLLLVSTLSLVLTVFGAQLYTYSVPVFTVFWDTVSPISSVLFYVFTCIGFWQSRFPGVRSGYLPDV